MNSKEIGDAVIRMEILLTSLHDKIDKGTPRCATNMAHIEAAKSDIKSLDKKYIWLRNLLVLGLLSITVSTATAYFTIASKDANAATTKIASPLKK